MQIFQQHLQVTLDAPAQEWLREQLGARPSDEQARTDVLFAQLRRRTGKTPLTDAGPGTIETVGPGRIDIGMWRTCDAAGALLLDVAGISDESLVDLFRHGDFEERLVVLRALAVRPITAATVELLGEVQRTNTVAHFEAGALDSDIAVRALAEGGEDSGFTRDDYHRLVLKAAFSDLAGSRMIGALEQADPKLSAMLQDFATEREAAGRPVWVDTYRYLGVAPCPGAEARLLGGLEHGADPIREAAVESLGRLAKDAHRPHLESRLAREPSARIRSRIEAAL